MPLLIDALYAALLVLFSPLWLGRRLRGGRWRTDLPGRLGRLEPLGPAGRPRVLIHAVSVGEVNAVRLLVERLAGEGIDVVLSVTTDTGIARAESLFGGHHRVVRAPLDFSRATRRFLDAVTPDAVALVELELWPNFTAACRRRGISVCVVNGRLSARSFRRYRLVARLVRPMFRRLAFAAVQSDEYAARFRSLGVPADGVIVTGTMKWDAVGIAPDDGAAQRLGDALGIDRAAPLIVAGSTAPGEHELLVAAVPPGVQLLCAPRRPEWFDQAAGVLAGCARRSHGERGSPTGRFLLDTIGELQHAYALADIVVVGRSFGDLHGSDMMEPAGLGKPVVVGPAVDDFRDTAQALIAAGALLQVTAAELPAALCALLGDPARRAEMGRCAEHTVRSRQGASERHAALILSLLDLADGGASPAPPCSPTNFAVPVATETAKEEKEERRNFDSGGVGQ